MRSASKIWAQPGRQARVRPTRQRQQPEKRAPKRGKPACEQENHRCRQLPILEQGVVVVKHGVEEVRLEVPVGDGFESFIHSIIYERLLWPHTVQGSLGTGLRFRHCSCLHGAQSLGG